MARLKCPAKSKNSEKQNKQSRKTIKKTKTVATKPKKNQTKNSILKKKKPLKKQVSISCIKGRLIKTSTTDNKYI